MPLVQRRSMKTASASIIACLALSALGQGAASGDESGPSGQPPSSGTKVVPRIDALKMFGPRNELERDLTAAPIAGNSSQLVANLKAQVDDNWGGVAAFNDYHYNNAAYTVGRKATRQDVIWDNCQHKSWTPDQLYSESAGAHFRNVPIPDEAKPASGSDGQLSVYNRATDQLWEFWRANKQSDGWHACWGGRIDNVSQSLGHFPAPMGVMASGLVSAGTSVSVKEARRAKIKHAVGLAIISAANWSEFSWPATRSDGNSPVGAGNAIREGQRFRLDPALEVGKLGLHPLAETIARAAQKYGFIITDLSGAVAVSTQSGAGIAARRGVDPWVGLRGTTPSYAVMKNFPWGQLEAMPLHFGKP